MGKWLVGAEAAMAPFQAHLGPPFFKKRNSCSCCVMVGNMSWVQGTQTQLFKTVMFCLAPSLFKPRPIAIPGQWTKEMISPPEYPGTGKLKQKGLAVSGSENMAQALEMLWFEHIGLNLRKYERDSARLPEISYPSSLLQSSERAPPCKKKKCCLWTL